MLIFLDYGKFEWKKFFKMLFKNLSFGFDIIPFFNFNFNLGSINFTFRIGRTIYSNSTHFNYGKYHFVIYFFYFSIESMWWTYEQNQN